MEFTIRPSKQVGLHRWIRAFV